MAIQLTPKQREQITKVVMVAGVVIGALIFAPKVGPLTGIKEVNQQLTRERRLLTDEKEQLREDKEKVEEVLPLRKAELEQRQIEAMEDALQLPKDPRMPDLLADLDRLQLMSGQLIRSERRLPDEDLETHVRLPLELTMRSDYHRFAYFINGLENSDRFSRVERMVITGIPESRPYDQQDFNVHDITLVLSTFMFKE